MGGKSIMVRVQAREGMKRIQLPETSDTKTLYEKIQEAFGFTCCAFQLYKDKGKSQLIGSSKSKILNQCGLRHGDLLFLIPEEGMNLVPIDEPMEETLQDGASGSGSSSNLPAHNIFNSVPVAVQKKSPDVVVKEDSVDVELNAKDGMIPRKKDPRSCKHGENAACVYCCPLPPYDEAYLKEHKIKHLSFHSYLRKLTSGVDKGKFVALEDMSVKIKEGCTTHLPWPKGICSKCQPSAVTLNAQPYRHVDSVMFENANIVESFLSYWRASGHQRMGLLYGNYEEHSDVPLGIRSRVAAIYEPRQETDRDGIKFHLNDDKISVVDEVAAALGLQRVGWIFTDLIPEDVSTGTVKHIRGGHSFFMSAQECITAAYFQSQHPNVSKHSPTGHFGSKFATVIVTGDDKNQVHMEGYQVSNQCMALVRDQCLLPTKDAPELGYVKESTNEQYVPDVYYKKKDEYGNEVTKIARPLPVEYLLVDVPVSTPKSPQFTFSVAGPGEKQFPIENRPIPGHLQDFNALAAYLNQFAPNTSFLRKACDFHFLIFIATMDIVHLRDYIGPLLEAIRTKDEAKANDWAKSEHWATVEQLVAASGHGGMMETRNHVSTGQNAWTCNHCTYHNVGDNSSCEVCQLPR